MPEIGKPIITKFSDTTAESLSYGYAVSISPLSQITIMASLLNGGYKIVPTIFKRDKSYSKKQQQKIISVATSRSLAEMMRLVMIYGTGRSANVKGIGLCGKTGTSQKVTRRGYSKNANVTQFIGAFPYTNPKYIISVMYDHPKAKNNLTTAAYNASKTAQKILQSIAPLLIDHAIDDYSDDVIQGLSRRYISSSFWNA